MLKNLKPGPLAAAQEDMPPFGKSFTSFRMRNCWENAGRAVFQPAGVLL